MTLCSAKRSDVNKDDNQLTAPSKYSDPNYNSCHSSPNEIIHAILKELAKVKKINRLYKMYIATT